jgi:hypothetical protein
MNAEPHPQSPTDFDREAARDAAVIRRAMRDIDEGRGREAGVLFDGLRARLLAMKAGWPASGAD